jgi:predicted RND superfamily exporter protein
MTDDEQLARMNAPTGDSDRRHRLAVVGLVARRILPIARHPVARVVASLAVVGFIVGGLLQFRVDTRLETFLPDDPSVASLEDKARAFGGDPVVVLLETEDPHDLLLDSKQFEALFRLEGELADIDDVTTVYGPATVLNQIAGSAQALLAQISGRRDGIRFTAESGALERGATKREAKAAGDRAVRAFELRYGKLLVQGLPAGLPTLRNSGFIRSVIFDAHGQPLARWSFVVPAPDTVAILIRPTAGLDQSRSTAHIEQIRDTVDATGLDVERVTVTGVPAVTADLSDQVEAEAPMLALLALALLLVRFLLVPAAGRRWRRLVPLAAALIGSAAAVATLGLLGMTLSLGAVVLLPLLLGIGSSFPLYLGATGHRRPVVVSAIASSAAFAALAASPLPFVRQLGGALALGILFTMLAGLLLVPRPAPSIDEGTPAARGRGPAAPRGSRVVAVVVAIAAAGVGWAGLAQATIAADPRDLAAGTDAIEDAEYAESVLGSSGEINVVLTGPDVLSTEALSWSAEAEDVIVRRHAGDLRPVISAPSLLAFLGDDPSPEQVRAGYRLVPSYISEAVVRPDGKQSLLTFGVSLQSLDEQQALLDDVHDLLPPPPEGYEAEIVGLPVVAAQAYDEVSADRYLPSVLGILAATIVLILGLRRRSDGIAGGLAAVLATGWTLALIVLLGIALTPLSLALGSLTTVTASEFTVLLADGRRRARSTARVVAWACATSAIGYLVLMASSLTVLREFGLVLVASVLVSYASARFAVWALRPADQTRGEVGRDADSMATAHPKTSRDARLSGSRVNA